MSARQARCHGGSPGVRCDQLTDSGKMAALVAGIAADPVEVRPSKYPRTIDRRQLGAPDGGAVRRPANTCLSDMNWRGNAHPADASNQASQPVRIAAFRRTERCVTFTMAPEYPADPDPMQPEATAQRNYPSKQGTAGLPLRNRSAFFGSGNNKHAPRPTIGDPPIRHCYPDTATGSTRTRQWVLGRNTAPTIEHEHPS